MPLCDNLVIWHPIPSGSRLCASASATADDFLAGIRLVGMDGSETQFLNADLDPGPAHRSLTDQGYAARLSITPGPSSPVVTVNAWVEDSAGERIFECSWNATGALKVRRVTLVLQP